MELASVEYVGIDPGAHCGIVFKNRLARPIIF